MLFWPNISNITTTKKRKGQRIPAVATSSDFIEYQKRIKEEKEALLTTKELKKKLKQKRDAQKLLSQKKTKQIPHTLTSQDFRNEIKKTINPGKKSICNLYKNFLKI